MSYQDFISRKLAFIGGAGIEAADLPTGLFDFQDALTRWALKRGRAAIFADTGLGKTRMQLAWASQIPGDVLILAPLAVAEQTVAEGDAMGVHVTHCRTSDDVRPGINITNYERLHRFDPRRFVGVVLDESSIIKHHDSKTLSLLLEAFRTTDYKLCATATPSPNDWTELGTHAEFLGICTRAEMLSEFFVHDGGETQVWRLKGHARQQFWRWVSSWGAMVKTPADLGFDGAKFKLPPIHVHQHIVECDISPTDGKLFALEASTLSERRAARRSSLHERVAECAAIVNANDRPWVVWCDLNAESEMLAREIRGAVEVKGSDSMRFKELAAQWFSGSVCFCDKLAAWRDQATSASIIKRIEKEETENRLSTKKIIEKTDETTSGSTCGRTASDRKSSLESSLLEISGSRSDEHNTPATQSLEKNPERRLGAGSQQTRANDSRSASRSTASLQMRMTGYSENKAGDAPSAAGSKNSTSIIATPADSSGESSVGNATSASVSSKTTSGAYDAPRCICGMPLGKRVLVSKTSIFGWGLNWQHCADMAFVGVTDSFESYYQAVRRCWRFGQKKQVSVHVFTSALEGAVLANLRRKEEDAKVMGEQLASETAAAVRENVLGMRRESNDYSPKQATKLPAFLRRA